MKPLISIIIVVLLGICEQAMAETDAELLRRLAELEAKYEQRKVVLVNKGAGWLRYRFDNRDLVIDAVKGIDLSDKKEIERIIDSVRTLRHHGKSCDIVINFWYKRIPVGVGRALPKSRTACESGCYQVEYSEEIKYGVRKRYIDIGRCYGKF